MSSREEPFQQMVQFNLKVVKEQVKLCSRKIDFVDLGALIIFCTKRVNKRRIIKVALLQNSFSKQQRIAS